jgi:hypothetical protein
MAVTDYDFNSTRNEVIERAFRIIGALSLGETLSADQILQGVTALNHVVKSWQSDHIFLWTLKALTISPLVGGTATYALSTDPAVIAVDKAFLRQSNKDLPLEVISWRDYQELPNKTDSGDPTCVTIDNLPAPTLYTWPVVSSVTGKSLYLLCITKLKDWDLAAGSGDFPVKFVDALTYSLAANLADEYGLPLGERNQLERKAASFYDIAKRGDRDRSDYEFVSGAFPSDRR